MRTFRSADIWSGSFLALVGLVIVIAGLQISSAFGERLPPSTLPIVMGGSMVLTAVLLVIRAVRSRGIEVAVEWPDGSGWKNIAITFVALAAYLALIDPIGMPIATFLFVTFLIWYLDRKLIKAVVIAAITAAIVLFAFIRGLELTFPVGPLSW